MRENRAGTFNLSSRRGCEKRAGKLCGNVQPVISEGLRKTCGKTVREVSACHLGWTENNVRENRAEKPCGDFQPVVSEGLRKTCRKTVRRLSTCHLGGAAKNVWENRAGTFDLSSRRGSENVRENRAGTFYLSSRRGCEKRAGKPYGKFQPVV